MDTWLATVNAPQKPELCSRLWDYEDAFEALTENKVQLGLIHLFPFLHREKLMIFYFWFFPWYKFFSLVMEENSSLSTRIKLNSYYIFSEFFCMM